MIDQKEQKETKNILVIASKGCLSSQEVLKQLFKVINAHRQIKPYSFEKYAAGATTIISKSDYQALNKIQLVFVAGQITDLLQSFSLFFNKDSPPILGFGMSEDYSTPLIYNFDTFHTEEIEQLIDAIIGQQKWINLPTDNLMKLSLNIDCQKIAQATAQIQIHRGVNQNVLILNLYILNKCQEQKIKIGTFKGDGLLISTPMGTVCKSMSLNGPIMNRNMQNILVTPICPLSMKFRTLCLPADTHLYLQIDEGCRTNVAEIYIDQSCKGLHLKKGEWIRIKMSSYRTRMVSSILQSNEEYFIRTLRNGLRWGQAYLPVQMPSFKVKRYSSLQ